LIAVLFYGSKIKAAHNSDKFTQKQFGQAVGVHSKTVVRWENGSAFPT